MANVLILDDDTVDLEILTRLLDQIDDEIDYHVASTADQASDLLRQRTFDIALIDYKLAGTTGIAFANQHFPNQQPPFTATVLLTAFGDETLATRAMKSGFLDYLPKSQLDRKRLSSTIHEASRRCKQLEGDYHRRQSLENFANLVAHDVRSPISYVFTSLEMISDFLPKETDGLVHEYIGHCRHSCEYTLKFISGLMSYAKTGQSNEKPIKVRLSEVVQIAMENIHEQVEHARATVTLENDLEFTAKKHEFCTLLSNLFSNAIKYSDKHPEITIKAELGTANVKICVSDNGCGIKAEYLTQIFNPLERAGRSDENGFGLGLASCKKIVSGHGGKIWCESEVGKGSKFFMVIPK